MDHIPTPPARALPQPPASARWHPRLDLAGAWLSLACAAHCITLPLLLAFVPAAMMALRSFQHPAHGAMTALLVMSRWEWVFAVVASSVAAASTASGAAGVVAVHAAEGIAGLAWRGDRLRRRAAGHRPHPQPAGVAPRAQVAAHLGGRCLTMSTKVGIYQTQRYAW